MSEEIIGTLVCKAAALEQYHDDGLVRQSGLAVLQAAGMAEKAIEELAVTPTDKTLLRIGVVSELLASFMPDREAVAIAAALWDAVLISPASARPDVKVLT